MDRIAIDLLAIAKGLVADDVVTDWVQVDFVSKLRVPAILKRFAGNLGGTRVWVLKADKKLYKDKFGWISVSWQVAPAMKGNRWSVQGILSFAPASNGSYANDKFKEFLEKVPLSGSKDTALFGIERRMMEIVPGADAERDVEGLISAQMDDVEKAKRFWTEAGKGTPAYAK